MDKIRHMPESARELHLFAYELSVHALRLIAPVVEDHIPVAQLIEPELDELFRHRFGKCFRISGSIGIPAVPSHHGETAFPSAGKSFSIGKSIVAVTVIGNSGRSVHGTIPSFLFSIIPFSEGIS